MKHKYKVPPTLGYIRHNPDYNQLTYYTGSIYEHEYDFPVTRNTTIGELATLTGQNGQAFIQFAQLIQNTEGL